MKKHSGKEYRVREIAYLLWERDGCPDGASDRHWFEAELLYDAEDAGRKAVEGEPPGDAAEKKSASAPPKAKAPVAGKKSVAAAEVAPPPAKPAAAKPEAAKIKVAAKRADTLAESASAKAPAAPKRKA